VGMWMWLWGMLGLRGSEFAGVGRWWECLGVGEWDTMALVVL
jgi:hypothetical protein